MRKPSGYWEDINNRQKFFCEYAKEAGFDPLQPENWESVQNHQLHEKKVDSLDYFCLQPFTQDYPIS